MATSYPDGEEGKYAPSTGTTDGIVATENMSQATTTSEPLMATATDALVGGFDDPK
jgi:hypothetical protein